MFFLLFSPRRGKRERKEGIGRSMKNSVTHLPISREKRRVFLSYRTMKERKRGRRGGDSWKLVTYG